MLTKKIFDKVGAIMGIIIFSPFIIIASLLIIFETGFPIIFKNKRVGLNGQIFTLYKLREYYLQYCTSCESPNKDEALKFEEDLKVSLNKRKGPLYKILNDPRQTKVGRWIEKHYIGEMLQFINVLKGDLTIVGPRPHQPREIKNYSTFEMRILLAKPGITCLSQISGGSSLDFVEEFNLDMEYLRKQSLFLDIDICIKTFHMWIKTWFYV